MYITLNLCSIILRVCWIQDIYREVDSEKKGPQKLLVFHSVLLLETWIFTHFCVCGIELDAFEEMAKYTQKQ